MRSVPSLTTIHKNINRYARIVGLTVNANSDGTYNVYDNVVGCNAFSNVTMDWACMVVYDSLRNQIDSENRSLARGA